MKQPRAENPSTSCPAEKQPPAPRQGREELLSGHTPGRRGLWAARSGFIGEAAEPALRPSVGPEWHPGKCSSGKALRLPCSDPALPRLLLLLLPPSAPSQSGLPA